MLIPNVQLITLIIGAKNLVLSVKLCFLLKFIHSVFLLISFVVYYLSTQNWYTLLCKCFHAWLIYWSEIRDKKNENRKRSFESHRISICILGNKVKRNKDFQKEYFQRKAAHSENLRMTQDFCTYFFQTCPPFLIQQVLAW